MMNDQPIIADLRAFWATLTAASADIIQLHAAAAEGLDTAVEGSEALMPFSRVPRPTRPR